jgi:hypothetical protein
MEAVLTPFFGFFVAPFFLVRFRKNGRNSHRTELVI